MLYFSLPRHEFGRVQTVLFPVYYAFNASVSLVGVLAYFRTQCLTSFERTSWIQVRALIGPLGYSHILLDTDTGTYFERNCWIQVDALKGPPGYISFERTSWIQIHTSRRRHEYRYILRAGYRNTRRAGYSHILREDLLDTGACFGRISWIQVQLREDLLSEIQNEFQQSPSTDHCKANVPRLLST